MINAIMCIIFSDNYCHFLPVRSVRKILHNPPYSQIIIDHITFPEWIPGTRTFICSMIVRNNNSKQLRHGFPRPYPFPVKLPDKLTYPELIRNSHIEGGILSRRLAE